MTRGRNEATGEVRPEPDGSAIVVVDIVGAGRSAGAGLFSGAASSS